MTSRLVVVEVHERGDDDDVARLVQVRRGTVDADDAALTRPRESVGHEPRAPRDVPEMNGFVRKDSCRVHEVGVNGDAPLVLEVRLRDHRPMDLGAEHLAPHRALLVRGVPRGYARSK